MQRSKKRKRDDVPVEGNTTTTTTVSVEPTITNLTPAERRSFEDWIEDAPIQPTRSQMRRENGIIRVNLDFETSSAETSDNEEEMELSETSEERFDRVRQQTQAIHDLRSAPAPTVPTTEERSQAVARQLMTQIENTEALIRGISGRQLSSRFLQRRQAVPLLGDEYHNLRPERFPAYLSVQYKDDRALTALGKRTAIVEMDGVSFDGGIPRYSRCVIPYEIWITRQYLSMRRMSFTVPVDFVFRDLCRFIPAVFSMDEIDSINKTINSVCIDFLTLNSLVISTSGFYVLPGKSEACVFETMWMKLGHAEIAAEFDSHRFMKELMQQEINRRRNETILSSMREASDDEESELQTTEGPIGVMAAARLLEREPVPARASEATIHQNLPSIYLLHKIDDVCGICLENMELRTRVWQCHKCERCLHILCANRMPRRECPSCRERIRPSDRNELMASVVPTRAPAATTEPRVYNMNHSNVLSGIAASEQVESENEGLQRIGETLQDMRRMVSEIPSVSSEANTLSAVQTARIAADAPRNDFSQAAEAMDRTQNEFNQVSNSVRFREEIVPRIRRVHQQVLGLQETAARVEESLMARDSTVQENTRAETEQTTDDRRQIVTDVMELAADVMDQRRREDEDRLSRVSAEVRANALESLDDYLRRPRRFY